MKLTKALLVLALAIAVAAPAYAETQNVKVSGAIDAYWFYRINYDMLDNNDASIVPVLGTVPSQSHGTSAINRSEADDFFRTNTQIEVTADMTDNVSAVVNLTNQRDWNSNQLNTTTNPARTAGDNVAADEYDIELDLAYVQMKEIFYSPLTLTIGLQDIWLGRGFIVGNNNLNWDRQNITTADEYSVQTAFDAVRATLDFNPWTVDLIYAKIDENNPNPEDDRDLWVAYVNYKFAEYNAVADGYFVGEVDRATVSGTSGSFNNETDTLGLRAQFDPISQITLGGEIAYEFGQYRSAITSPSRDRNAWAANLFGTYKWDNTWKPSATLEWVHFSGEEDMGAAATTEYKAWNALFRGKFWTAYGDFREFVYATAQGDDQPATTNQDFVQVKGAMKPLNDLLIEASYTYFWVPERIHQTAGVLTSPSENDNLGSEVDFQATYDYTDDVAFGLLLGWFIPGDFYNSPNDATVMDLVTSVKVSF